MTRFARLVRWRCMARVVYVRLKFEASAPREEKYEGTEVCAKRLSPHTVTTDTTPTVSSMAENDTTHSINTARGIMNEDKLFIALSA